MRMRIVLGNSAVGGPAGMANTLAPVHRLLEELGLKIGELANGTADRHLAVVDDRDARGVVAAIFEALQPANHYVRCFTWSHITYDATHLALLPVHGSSNSPRLQLLAVRVSHCAREPCVTKF